MDTENRTGNAKMFHVYVYGQHLDTWTHCEYVLEYLKTFGSITQLEALQAFGCMRLSGRIADLRADGYNISTEINKGKKNYAIYRLENEDEHI